VDTDASLENPCQARVLLDWPELTVIDLTQLVGPGIPDLKGGSPGFLQFDTLPLAEWQFPSSLQIFDLFVSLFSHLYSVRYLKMRKERKCNARLAYMLFREEK